MGLAVEDQLAIQQLYARYNHAIDFGDGDGWAACFTPDGVFNGGQGPQQGTDALKAFAGGFASRMKARHWNTNLVVEGSGDTANGKCYLMLMNLADGKATPLVTAVYHDELKKTGGEWKFTSRSVQPD
jgi:ketosteroid isomerase-like protein